MEKFFLPFLSNASQACISLLLISEGILRKKVYNESKKSMDRNMLGRSIFKVKFATKIFSFIDLLASLKR